MDQINRRLIDPTADATPENVGFLSFVSAPRQSSANVSLLALGDCARINVPCRVLFSSEDGGASWAKLGSKGLSGDTLVLPPDYPRDPRIFVMGATGLQASTDGGATFTTVSPVTGAVSISPRFDRGDPRIFIGGDQIFAYDAGTGLTTLAQAIPLEAQDRTLWTRNDPARITLSPAFADDHVYFSSVARPGTGPPRLFRCVANRCAAVSQLTGMDVQQVLLSPGFATDGDIYAQAVQGLFRSGDGGRNFVRVRDELAQDRRGYSPGTIATGGAHGSFGRVLYSATDASAAQNTEEALLRSADGGRTWSPLPSTPTYYYAFETRSMATAPNGSIFAFGARGIACSCDEGKTWYARCAGPF